MEIFSQTAGALLGTGDIVQFPLMDLNHWDARCWCSRPHTIRHDVFDSFFA